MKQHTNKASIFPKQLFWDMYYIKLNLFKDFIIPRTLFATTEATFEEDIKKLEQLYTPRVILKHPKATKERISNNV